MQNLENLIINMCNDLLPEQLSKVVELLKSLFKTSITDMSTLSKVVKNEKKDFCCPFCQSNLVVKNGHTVKKIQRYKCKDCNRRFNDNTLTTCFRTRQSYETWLEFFKCMNDKLSIRKTAAKLNLNKNTVFSMRHKVLNVLSNFRESVELKGKVEADEMYLGINLKGLSKEKMPRFSKPRQSCKNTKRGINNHQVCILTAIDEYDNIFLKIVSNGPITSNEVINTFQKKSDNIEILVTDCKSSYEKYAKDFSIKLEQIKSGTYKNLNGYTLSEINGLHSNFEHFLSTFKGVSTKHLQGYIDWFIFDKYLNYSVEIIEQINIMMNYSISKESKLICADIYQKEFPFNIYEAYSDYNYSSSPVY